MKKLYASPTVCVVLIAMNSGERQNFTVDNNGADWDQKYRVRGCLAF